MSCDTEKTITEIKRGSTFEQSLSFLDENEDAVSISGWTAESDLKVSVDQDPLLSFDIDDSLFVSGLITISADSSETLSLPANFNLEYDVKLTDPSGSVYYTDTMYLKTSRHITD
jgi:hypothetical protein